MIAFVAARVIPAALSLLPPKMDTPEARAMLLAIGGQESAFRHRRQVNGPARGLWQFERGGLIGAQMHPSSSKHADAVCAALLYDRDQSDELHRALADNDILACALARLLLWTDAKPLPPESDAGAAWNYYLRVWRPGRPHPDAWPAHWRRAWDAL
jgi:hypothetical protein